MNARRFTVLLGADQFLVGDSIFSIREDAGRSFTSFAAAWKFVHSKEFRAQFAALTSEATKRFGRAEIGAAIMLDTMGCAYITANERSCDSEWTRCWEL